MQLLLQLLRLLLWQKELTEHVNTAGPQWGELLVALPIIKTLLRC